MSDIAIKAPERIALKATLNEDWLAVAIGMPVVLKRRDQACVGGQTSFDRALHEGLVGYDLAIGHSETMPLDVTIG